MSKAYISKALRLRVSEQARFRCGYCLTQEELTGTPMEIDHIIPESLAGRTEDENLWLACKLCNDYKGDRVAALDQATDEIVPLFNPRQQRWSEHFAWTPTGETIVGLTAVGRVTIELLNLNRESLVRARRRWVEAGWHPPKD
ncbi:MAG TPA: HNH endonuclease [Ktedonobacterales bacterium]|jgi:5-methylcytosine-specific restriction endonuclease McrA